MRIVIDMQGAQSESRFRGIGRYSMALALAIARNAGEHEIWLVLNASFPESIEHIRHAFKGLIPQEHIRVFEVPLAVAEENPNNTVNARVAELIREYFLEQLNPDTILLTSLFEGYIDNAVTSIGNFSSTPTAVILYDLIPYLDQKKYLPEKYQHDYYMRKIESLKNANLLLSISESSKKEGLESLHIEESKIQNISTAVDESFCPLNLSEKKMQSLHDKYSITRKMIMYAPGGFDVRKNFDGLIEAYGMLAKEIRKEHQLVIVSKIQDGDRHNLQHLAKNFGLSEDELVLTGYVPDKDLIALYSTATLFVFPSKHEGFGLPALEAMSCGAPVIGSNTTSIPEVIGLEEALFDPKSPSSISTKIEQVLTDEDFRNNLIYKQQEHRKIFSWDKSAKKALKHISSLKFQKNTTDDSIIKAIASYCVHMNDKELSKISNAIAFNTKNNDKQILLDISELTRNDAKSGIQRVVRSILAEMLEKTIDGYVVKAIYFNGFHYSYATNFVVNLLNDNAKNIIDSPVCFKQDDIYLALDLNAHLVEEVHDFHKHLHSAGIQVYFIVYDLLLLQHPEWWPDGISKMFERWMKSISEVSTGLICISQTVADDVKNWMIANPPNRLELPIVKSFHLGADIDNSIPSKGLASNADEILKTLKATSTFLMVGTIEPRKGHAQTIKAFTSLWHENIDVNLVIVGKKGWMVDELVDIINNHTEKDKRLFWLEAINDEYLEKVYEASTCLISASEGEGFGLPLIEAAQKKKPIIVRDISVFREVAGEYAYYFENNNNPKGLAKSIKIWLALYKNDKHPKSDDMPWLTWAESAKNLMEIILDEK